MKIRTADTTVRDLDVNVVLLPLLWLKLLPDHLSVDRGLVLSQPSLEFVIGARHVVGLFDSVIE